MTQSTTVGLKGNPILDVGNATAVYAQPIRCGIVGLGRIGWCHHAQILMKHGGFRLVAVADPEADRCREAQAACACATYPSIRQLLRNPDVELVVVATPSTFHQRMAIQALRAGKHVLVEKPAARSARGIDAMAAAAQRVGRVLTMHHNRRLDPDALYVKETIESGRLGKVFRIRRCVSGFSRRNDWQTLLKYGGGMIGNWGVHLVDQCLQLLTAPVADVWADVNLVFNPGDAEDDLLAIVRGEDGLVLEIEMTSANAAPLPNWVVLGSAGTLWVTGSKAHLKVHDPTKLAPVVPYDAPMVPNRQYGIIPGPDRIDWIEAEEEARPARVYPSYYDNLYRAIRHGEALLVSPESARRTYAVLDRIRRGTGF